MEKKFLIVDNSGRGAKCKLTLSRILACWNGEYADENGTTLADWLETSDIGDEFENLDDNATFTRIV